MSSWTTEEKIIRAAQSVFIEKGKDGARMQEIADKAGINKALLHYYFRSKDKLFVEVFQNVFGQLFADISPVMSDNAPFKEKVVVFVDRYTKFLHKNRFIPMFILSEMNRGNRDFKDVFDNITPLVSEQKDRLIATMIDEHKISEQEAEHFIIDLLSLCIFSVIARPMLSNVFFKGNEACYQDFMEGRNDHIIEILHNWIDKKSSKNK
jgi:AcrR family transcriptional regulator